MATARIGNIDIDYDVIGDRGTPLVMIMGIGASGALWDDELLGELAGRGFQVIRFDHRDIGRSSRLDHLGVPHPRDALVRGFLGLRVDAPYTLSDLAGDVVGLLDHLDIQRAHVLGVSMGGMVAQHLAIEHRDRIASMTSLSSSSGTRRYLPKRSAMKALFMERPRDADQAVEQVVAMFDVIGSPGFPRDADRLRILARRAVDRGLAPRGFLRHFAAIMASGDRRARLRGVTTPSLVIHGVADPLIRVGAGRSTATAIPDAWWLPIDGMGHDLPKPVWPRLVEAVVMRARSA